ncbi:MAG: energy transducer TonB [Gemmatimonadota bacterium]|nr:energy transducer TonB [Gemmatimonadota bacterium]
MNRQTSMTPGTLALVALLTACGGEQRIEQPVPLYGESPVEYPLELWDQGVEGEVLLRVLVDADGAIDSVAVETSSGHGGLDTAAIQGVRQMQFTPARLNGRRTDAWARVPVRFSKKPKPEGGTPRP